MAASAWWQRAGGGWSKGDAFRDGWDAGRRRERAHEWREATGATMSEAAGAGRRHGDLERSVVLANEGAGGIAWTTNSRPVVQAGQRSGSLPTMRE